MPVRGVVGIEQVKIAKHIVGVKLEHGKRRRAGGSDSESELFLPVLWLMWPRCQIGG
jgi:hypothetical protein